MVVEEIVYGKEETFKWIRNNYMIIFLRTPDIPNKITAAFGMTCDVNLKTKDKKKYIQIEVKKSKLPLNLDSIPKRRTGIIVLDDKNDVNVLNSGIYD